MRPYNDAAKQAIHASAWKAFDWYHAGHLDNQLWYVQEPMELVDVDIIWSDFDGVWWSLSDADV